MSRHYNRIGEPRYGDRSHCKSMVTSVTLHVLATYKYYTLTRSVFVLSTMILVSRPPSIAVPPSIQTLDEDLAAFLQRPYQDDATAGGNPPIATPALTNPATRDRLLSYAYAVYDTFVTCQLPLRSIPPDHAALLLPLLELLHGLHPYNSPVALLLGCVYHHNDLIQRSLQINHHILRYDPDNVRLYPPLSWLFV